MARNGPIISHLDTTPPQLTPSVNPVLPNQPIGIKDKCQFSATCHQCHLRFKLKSDLKIHTKGRHFSIFRRNAFYHRYRLGLKECRIGGCQYTGNRTSQLIEHSNNRHPMDIIRLMFSDKLSDRKYFTTVNPTPQNRNHQAERRVLERLNKEKFKVMRELFIEPGAINRTPQKCESIRTKHRRIPKASKRCQGATGPTETFDSLFSV